MPYFIYQLKLSPAYRVESNWTDETRKIISDHFNHLKQNCDKGKVLLAGKSDLAISDTENFGICIFEAESKEDAQKFMDSDPTVINGVMTARLFPFSLAMLNISS
jgi:uncharacterized protein YciI